MALQLPVFLYRLFDADGCLLYLGITGNLAARMSQHSQSKAWWGQVTTVSVGMHPDRRSAMEAELVAIVSESPRWNVAGTARELAADRVERTKTLDARGRLLRDGWHRTIGDGRHAMFECPCGRHRIPLPNGSLSAGLVRKAQTSAQMCEETRSSGLSPIGD